MDPLYPPSPTSLPADLARPTAAYRRRVAAAVLGLAFFLALYFSITGWLGWLTWRGVQDVLFAGEWLRGIAVGVPSAFLFVVLTKGLFAVKRMNLDGLIEITQEQEPALVAFIHRLADETGAPRPKRVFLSPEVNAAVFYDVGLGNVFLPTRKNLNIGLGLVNVTTLDEFKAVVAHELGHFAQRSMGVGSWVYLSQQVVGDLVARRDIMDRFLDGLSVIDFRIAWIGWVMRLIIWSLRAVIEQAFRLVVTLNRALGRHMELSADLVAASVSGSDSLVHALHRLSAADAAWGLAANRTVAQANHGKALEDLYAIQSKVIERHREVHALVGYGQTPAAAEGDPAAHRVFSRGVAEAPRMWATHPPNHEREENLKARYVPSMRDERSAWCLFRDPEATRRQMTKKLVDSVAQNAPTPIGSLEAVPLEDTLAAVDGDYDRPHLDRCYQGFFTFPMLTRMAQSQSELVADPGDVGRGELLTRHAALYPPSMAETVEACFELGEEKNVLEALADGFLEAPGGIILHRGRQLRRKVLPDVIAEVQGEFEARRGELFSHFREARGVHLAMARELGGGWESYLGGLLDLLAYGQHTQAELFDVADNFENVLAIVFADGNVSSSEMRRLESNGADVAHVVQQIWHQREDVEVPQAVAEQLKVDSWTAAMPDTLGLYAPTANDFAADWIGAMHSWVDVLGGALSALSMRTLDLLVESEAQVARCFESGEDAGLAPPRPRVPDQYTRLRFGGERERQKHLGWWDKFLIADGFMAATARLAVAAAILAPAFVVTWDAGPADPELFVHNGLATTVAVQVGEHDVELGPMSRTSITAPAGAVSLRATAADGRLIEELSGQLDVGGAKAVYNIAGAAAFVRYTITYGSGGDLPPTFLGARRWFSERVDYPFREPPESLQSSTGHAQRTALDAMPELPPRETLQYVDDLAQRQAMAQAHGRFDDLDSPGVVSWIRLLDPEIQRRVLEERLAANPHHVRLERAWMDLVSPEQRAERCGVLAAASRAAPGDIDLAYLEMRCRPRGRARGDAMIQLFEENPAHPWAAFAAGYSHTSRGDFGRGAQILDSRVLGGFGELTAALLVARNRRVLADGQPVDLDDLRQRSRMLDGILRLEAHDAATSWPLADAMQAVAVGRAEQAPDTPGLSPEEQANVLHLAAASRGATAELVRRALAAPPPPAPGPAWANLGLLLREGGDTRAVVAHIETSFGSDAGSLARALDVAALRADPQSLEALLLDHDPLTQAHARVAALIALGSDVSGSDVSGDAPEAWRRQVTGFLFLHERPTF